MKLLQDLIKDSILIAPIDLNEDGRLEVLCQYMGKDGKIDIKIIYNNFWTDAFFLKTMMVYDHKKRGSIRKYMP
jgi:hypothetical protein